MTLALNPFHGSFDLASYNLTDLAVNTSIRFLADSNDEVPLFVNQFDTDNSDHLLFEDTIVNSVSKLTVSVDTDAIATRNYVDTHAGIIDTDLTAGDGIMISSGDAHTINVDLADSSGLEITSVADGTRLRVDRTAILDTDTRLQDLADVGVGNSNSFERLMYQQITVDGGNWLAVDARELNVSDVDSTNIAVTPNANSGVRVQLQDNLLSTAFYANTGLTVDTDTGSNSISGVVYTVDTDVIATVDYVDTNNVLVADHSDRVSIQSDLDTADTAQVISTTVTLSVTDQTITFTDVDGSTETFDVNVNETLSDNEAATQFRNDINAADGVSFITASGTGTNVILTWDNAGTVEGDGVSGNNNTLVFTVDTPGAYGSKHSFIDLGTGLETVNSNEIQVVSDDVVEEGAIEALLDSRYDTVTTYNSDDLPQDITYTRTGHTSYFKTLAYTNDLPTTIVVYTGSSAIAANEVYTKSITYNSDDLPTGSTIVYA